MANLAASDRANRLLDAARQLAVDVGESLRGAGQSVATAESCTGGLVGNLLTDVAGSSDYVLGGVISYSNEAKRDLLGVPDALLQRFGAVSEPVALAMAEGARRRFGADYGISITGIAGPGGGSPEKPVGLVYLGVATARATRGERYLWQGDRIENKAESALAALRLLQRAVAAETSPAR